jgi:ribosomal protein S18 acetylase RimI-like enzyme
MTISLRAIEPSDEPVLHQIYASSRADELALVPWSEEQKDAFLLQQSTAQHQYYQENYAGADFDLILRDGTPAGRLYVARWPEEIRIVDIAILPAHRNAGIGTSLLRDLLSEGAATGRRVSIHVEQFNPARHLYQRLGFVQVAEHGVYLKMEWSPPAQANIAS